MEEFVLLLRFLALIGTFWVMCISLVAAFRLMRGKFLLMEYSHVLAFTVAVILVWAGLGILDGKSWKKMILVSPVVLGLFACEAWGRSLLSRGGIQEGSLEEQRLASRLWIPLFFVQGAGLGALLWFSLGD